MLTLNPDALPLIKIQLFGTSTIQ